MPERIPEHIPDLINFMPRVSLFYRLSTCSHNFGQVLAVFNSQVDIVNSVFLNNTFSAIANTPATSLDIISFVGAPRWKGGMVFLYYNQSANSTAQQGMLVSCVPLFLRLLIAQLTRTRSCIGVRKVLEWIGTLSRPGVLAAWDKECSN